MPIPASSIAYCTISALFFSRIFSSTRARCVPIVFTLTFNSLAIGTAEANRFLVLFADDYTEDDMTGEEHTATTIAADRRLVRDVRDFLHRAKQQGWP